MSHQIDYEQVAVINIKLLLASGQTASGSIKHLYLRVPSSSLFYTIESEGPNIEIFNHYRDAVDYYNSL